MEQSMASVLRRKASEKETRVALLGTIIRDFDGMIAQLEGQIAAEEDRTRIKDPGHPAYSMFAKAAAKRRQNLLVSGTLWQIPNRRCSSLPRMLFLPESSH